MCIATLGMLAYALQDNEWYSMKVNGTEYKTGLFYNCTNQSCAEIKLNTSVSCGDATGSAVQIRYWAVRALFFFQGFCAILTLAAAVLQCQRGAGAGSAAAVIALSAIGAAAGGAGCGLYGISIQSFFLCGKKFCEGFASAAGCSEVLSIGFIIAAAAGGPCLASIGAGVGIIVLRRRATAAAAPPGGLVSSTEPLAALQQSTGEVASSPPRGATDPDFSNIGDVTVNTNDGSFVTAADENGSPRPTSESAGAEGAADGGGGGGVRGASEAPDGDWIWDEESSMWWSAENQLFLNPSNGHMYSPSADMWWSAETGWYSSVDDGEVNTL